MVWKAYCDACGVQIENSPESDSITVNVDGMVYYEGQLCQKHWKELGEILDKFLQDSGGTQ